MLLLFLVSFPAASGELLSFLSRSAARQRVESCSPSFLGWLSGSECPAGLPLGVARAPMTCCLCQAAYARQHRRMLPHTEHIVRLLTLPVPLHSTTRTTTASRP